MSNQNPQGHEFTSFSPNFRIEVNNPQVGFNGPGIYDLYGFNDDGDVSLAGMTQGGIYRLYNDRTIEIIGGQNSERGGVDICITGMKGSILITAQENGEVLIKGAKVTVESKGDMHFKSGGNMKLDCGNRFDIYAKEAYCDAPHSYGPDCIATEDNANSMLNQVFKGLKAEGIARAAASAAGGPGAVAAINVADKAIKALS
tara:strand:- start:503 stop:1105 length:603 start_codon:yes stop_codon:yes gene_type:complete